MIVITDDQKKIVLESCLKYFGTANNLTEQQSYQQNLMQSLLDGDETLTHKSLAISVIRAIDWTIAQGGMMPQVRSLANIWIDEMKGAFVLRDVFPNSGTRWG